MRKDEKPKKQRPVVVAKPTAEPEPAPTKEPEEFVRRDEPAPSAAAPPKRISFPITEAGGPDWDNMQGATQQKLKAVFEADPDSAKKLGVKPEIQIVEEPAEVIKPEHCEALYVALNDIAVYALSKQWGVPQDQIRALIQYDRLDLDLMCPPTAAVINRYLPSRLSKYQDLFLLGMVLYNVHQRKYLNLKHWVETQATARRLGKTNAAAAAAWTPDYPGQQPPE